MEKLSNRNIKDICKKYKDKICLTSDICKEYRISPNTLYSIIKQNNIQLRGNRLLNKEQKNIVKLYKSGLTVNKISKQYNISKSSIIKYLKKNNIKTRKTAGRFKKQYNIDDNLLKKINSNEKAQFIGLIYSDGSLSKYNNTISIRLREDDAEYLDKFRTKLLKSNKPLYFIKNESMISPSNNKKYSINHKTAILDITNKTIYEDALKLGLCPNKTKANLHIPNIPKKYIPYFILGLFEGDGCVTSSKNSYSFTIACQSNMANDLCEYFKKLNIKAYNYKRNSINIVQVSNKKDIKKIFNLFYKKPTPTFMVRKYLKYIDIIKQMQS